MTNEQKLCHQRLTKWLEKVLFYKNFSFDPIEKKWVGQAQIPSQDGQDLSDETLVKIDIPTLLAATRSQMLEGLQLIYNFKTQCQKKC